MLTYRAVAGNRQSCGQTAGEALDEIAKQLQPEEVGTLVIIQQHQPDQFFSAEQQGRLENLMNRWRKARDAGSTLTDHDQMELETLVEAELRAAGMRASAIANELEP